MRIKSLPVLALVAALAIAACGTGSGSAAPAGTEGGRSGAPASPPPDSSSGPTSPAPSASSNLVLPHEDPALEARLPDTVDGNPLFTLSVGPVASAGNEGAEPVKKLVSEIGDGTGNFGLAFANDPSATADPFNYFALRIPGAPTAQLVDRAGCGVVVPPGRPDLLADAIRRARDGELDLAEMGRRGRDYVAAEADRRIAVERYRTLLAELR